MAKEGTEQGVQREQGVHRKPNLSRFAPNQIRSINKALTSVSEKTLVRKISSPESTDKLSSSLIASESVKTPIQQKKNPSDNFIGDSSGSARDKSVTPTLTDLENSVHYDCRLDKVPRVAKDYALPEEFR